MTFPTRYEDILERIRKVDAVQYGKTRNFSDGAVSYLSPYISRGVISTRMIMEHILQQDLPFYTIEKFIQELAWRDYWQQIWIAKGDGINQDLKQEQKDVIHYQIPSGIIHAATGIDAVDNGIEMLQENGYMHNHMRMYVAAIACNNAKSHWKLPAQWLFYHLLDADWASNALSWQWVAGTNSNKNYIANQDNINKYFKSNQKGSFLDKTYEEVAKMACPNALEHTVALKLQTTLPISENFTIDQDIPTLIYNEYNLDPNWRKDLIANRVILLDPKRFEQYPMGENTINFIQALRKNIPNLKLFSGTFEDFKDQHKPMKIYFKEHPLNKDYKGTEDPRDWMFNVQGYYPSFFQFWKKCRKELNQLK